MRERRKSSLRTELTKQKKIQELRHRFATAKMGKTQKTNSFLNDPIAFHSLQNNQEHEHGQPADIEPWLEELESSEATRIQERKIRKEINYLLGLAAQEEGQHTINVNTNKRMQNNFLARKLKKYQPANSSFSLFYGEKRSIDKVKAKAGDQIEKSKSKLKLKLPALPGKKSLQEIKQMRFSKISRASRSDRSLSQNSPSRDYINQIGEIDRFGQILTDYSHLLISRIDRASSMLNKKYQKLNDITESMTQDVGKYELEEQKSKAYRSSQYEVPVKYLRK